MIDIGVWCMILRHGSLQRLCAWLVSVCWVLVKLQCFVGSRDRWEFVPFSKGLKPWWRHQMETLSPLLAICAGNSPVPGEFPTHRPVTRSFDVFFDLRLNKRLSKQTQGWWFETQSWSLWRHCNEFVPFSKGPKHSLARAQTYCLLLWLRKEIVIESTFPPT